jgi:hypothetical protein
MSRKAADRQPLLDWVAAHPLGVTAKQIKAYTGWADGGYCFEVMRKLRAQGLVEQYGRTGLARWCSPQALPAVKAWHAVVRQETIERNRIRKRKNKDYTPNVPEGDWLPRQIIVPASECRPPAIGVRSVFELGAV